MATTIRHESDVDFLERILRERGEMSTTAIRIAAKFQRGLEMVVNSRAAELRKRGVDVRCRRDGWYPNGRGKWVYWIEESK